MAQFITRVELHRITPDEPAYQNLHLEMSTRGFKRTIFSKENIEFNLPPAEYNLIANIGIYDVLNLAKEAANLVDTNNSILVSEIFQATWDGLPRK